MTTTIDRVEQARASGRTVEWVVEHLGVSPRVVVGVWRRMDRAAAEKSEKQ